jgi:hypothetical protein
MVSSARRSGRSCEPRDDGRCLSRMILKAVPRRSVERRDGGCPYRRPRAARRSDRARCESAAATRRVVAERIWRRYGTRAKGVSAQPFSRPARSTGRGLRAQSRAASGLQPVDRGTNRPIDSNSDVNTGAAFGPRHDQAMQWLGTPIGVEAPRRMTISPTLFRQEASQPSVSRRSGIAPVRQCRGAPEARGAR